MNYDEMEKAADELKRIIKEQKGIEPREYAIQGSNGMLFLSYAPGEHFGFPTSFILQDEDWVIEMLSNFEFKPVWIETETGQKRIDA